MCLRISKLCRTNFIGQSQNRKSWLIIPISILDEKSKQTYLLKILVYVFHEFHVLRNLRLFWDFKEIMWDGLDRIVASEK